MHWTNINNSLQQMIEAQLLIVEVLQKSVVKSLTGGLEENSAYPILILPPRTLSMLEPLTDQTPQAVILEFDAS